MSAKTVCATLLAGLLYCAAAAAEERQIYKHVDEKGNVVYSQTPPTGGSGVKKLSAQPAYRGRGGNVGPASPYGDVRIPAQDYRQDQYRNAIQQRQLRAEDARNKRLAELEAECNRNRGTDCSNAEALRYIESTKIPQTYRR